MMRLLSERCGMTWKANNSAKQGRRVQLRILRPCFAIEPTQCRLREKGDKYMTNYVCWSWGQGSGGLGELSTRLSEQLVDAPRSNDPDRSERFVFLRLFEAGYNVQPERTPGRTNRLSGHREAGGEFRQETITAIDPVTRRVTTNRGIYEADVLVVALGADYDLAATPGLEEGGNEFYFLRRRQARAGAGWCYCPAGNDAARRSKQSFPGANCAWMFVTRCMTCEYRSTTIS